MVFGRGLPRQATAAVFALGSTTTHAKVAVAVSLGQKMPPVTIFHGWFRSDQTAATASNNTA